jgi:3-phosphoshikimate 1-carboxyvinyltransferase
MRKLCMDLQVFPTKSLSGKIVAPPSKSYSHRAFFMAALAQGTSYIRNPLTEGDLEVTITGLRNFGVNITKVGTENAYRVEGLRNLVNPQQPLDLKNSGTSIRIISALSAISSGTAEYTGLFFQRGRPLKPLLDALEPLGLKFAFDGKVVKIHGGTLQPGTIKIPGDISSQFITALLLALPRYPMKDAEFRLELTSPLVSAPYVDITLEMLKWFGIKVEIHLDQDLRGYFRIPTGQQYHPRDVTVPGDFSSIAFPLAASALAEGPVDVTISNLDFDSAQGDKAIIEVLQGAGANIQTNHSERKLHVSGGRSAHPLQGTEINMGNIPDLFPILCVVGTCSEGTTNLINAGHVRLKETDRVSVMARELHKMGVEMTETPTSAQIKGCAKLAGATFKTDLDHRIVMSLTVASMVAASPSIVTGVEVVKDSYPDFFPDMEKIGLRTKPVTTTLKS